MSTARQQQQSSSSPATSAVADAPPQSPPPSPFQGQLHRLAHSGRWEELGALLVRYFPEEAAAAVTVAGQRGPAAVASSPSGGGGGSTGARTDDTNPNSAPSPADGRKSSASSAAEASPNNLPERDRLLAELRSPQGAQRFTPLAIASIRAPLPTIALMLRVCPDSAAVEDAGGSLALHLVATFRRGGGAEQDGGSGRAAAAVAAQSSLEEEASRVIDLLIGYHPPSLSHRNRFGHTPLHAALVGRTLPNEGMVASLLLLPPSSRDGADDDDDNDDGNARQRRRQHALRALSVADSAGRLPLHYAAGRNASTGMLRLLVDEYPPAACVADSNGDLPVHLLRQFAEKEQREEEEADAEQRGAVGMTTVYRTVPLESVELLLGPLLLRQQRRFGLGPDAVDLLGQVPDTRSRLGELLRRVERLSSSADVTAARGPPGAFGFEGEEEDNDGDADETDDAVPAPTAEARRIACGLPSSGPAPHLPLHIAAEFGAARSTLLGLCRSYPSGASTPLPLRSSSSIRAPNDGDDGELLYYYPIELLERGRAGREAEAASKLRRRRRHRSRVVTASATFDDDGGGGGGGGFTAELTDEELDAITEHYEQCSDLLFAFCPTAVPAKFHRDQGGGGGGDAGSASASGIVSGSSASGAYSAGKNRRRRATGMKKSGSRRRLGRRRPYRFDRHRLRRLEDLIRSEATDPDPGSLGLSITASRVWEWFCTYQNATHPSDNCGQSVGWILEGLGPAALWRLSISVGSSSGGRGHGRHCENLKVLTLHNGHTVPEEARARTPSTTFEQLLRHGGGTGWQYYLTSCLEPADAIVYSSVCRRTYASGVRTLEEIDLDEPDGDFDFEAGSGRREEHSEPDSEPEPWQDISGALVTAECTHTIYVTYELEVQSGNDGGYGGLLVVRTDDPQLRPNVSFPWGSAVLASEQVNTSKVIYSSSSNEVRLSFQHKPGQTYGLWSYGSDCTVSVSNVRFRQLVHSSDARGRTPLHVLLSTKDPLGTIQLRRHVSTLMAAGFGSMGDVPLHYALKCNASEKVLRALIAENPSSLMDTDREGRTPLHAAFLLSREEPPHAGIIKALLTTPGENATRLKDSHVRLPLHIAAERGASEPILKLLVDAYPDGCYRVNKDGDLPIHLLVRSGMATTSAVELLIRPIMHNETICRVGGSRGHELPLHIAAEYQCCYKVLETLLRTYGEGAAVPRTRSQPRENEGDLEVAYALDLFERWRETAVGTSGHNQKRRGSYVLGSRDSASSEGAEEHGEKVKASIVIEDLSPVKTKAKRRGSRGSLFGSKASDTSAKEAAMHDMLQADFDLRSDLIFVYAPNLMPADKSLGQSPYRKDRKRIKRLQNLVRREAIQCGESDGNGDNDPKSTAEFTEMARLAWCFLCSFENLDDPGDNYTEAVRATLHGLSTAVVTVLANVTNPHSKPVPGIPIKDCATPACAQLIQSRIRFVGRYVLDDHLPPVHKSDSCLVTRAKDYSATEEFKRVEDILKGDDRDDDPRQDIHDNFESMTDDDMGTVVHHMDSALDALMKAFVDFAHKAGVDEDSATREMRRLLGDANEDADGTRSYGSVSDLGDGVSELGDDHPVDDSVNSGANVWRRPGGKAGGKEAYRKAFKEFCAAHHFAEGGMRHVVIKFMMYRSQFEREKISRSRLNLSGMDWPVPPILEDFDVDRVQETKQRVMQQIFEDSDEEDEVPPMMSMLVEKTDSDIPDNKDELYALHIVEKNSTVPTFSLYKYALVMPGGDRDLAQIALHEELSIMQIREYMHQVALSLQRLHENFLIHGDLKMDNIVRFGDRLVLVDLDSSCIVQSMDDDDDHIEYLGGSSHKFSTGVMPPEMIAKINLETEERHRLTEYEEYWRDVADDAKDLQLLTPDDVHTINTVVKTLLARSDAAKNMGSSQKSLRACMGEPLAGLQDPSKNWKDILSLALITISFEDLPHTLSNCDTLKEFASAWDRLISNCKLWEKVCPRLSLDGNFAYVIKTFDERPNDGHAADDSMLPYELVAASEQVDIWALGLLLYALCSGGNLFHVGFQCDLRSFSAYAADLQGWTKESAERIVRSNVDDPIAQDLLVKILVPERYRLKNMSLVLQHPFFGPSSCLEAQRILERHEEQRLVLEETIIINRMTQNTRRRYELGSEKQCKIIFDEERLVTPTAIVVLPYELEMVTGGDNWSSDLQTNEAERPAIATDDYHSIELAVAIGKHLLDINKSTARLAFWLMMKKNLAKSAGSAFKSKMKSWLKRARSEPCGDVAKDILSTIGCGPEYSALCVEVLEKGDTVSNARAYIKNPMAAAKEEIQQSTRDLMQCYSSQFFYLLDEFRGVPVVFNVDGFESNQDESTQYPIMIEPGANLLQPLLLPFMNVAAMIAIAADKLNGLARMLGLPDSSGIPEEWQEMQPFLVHRLAKTSTIAEFGVLQDVMRKKERRALLRKSRLRQDGTDGSSVGDLSHPSGQISTTSEEENENRGSSCSGRIEMRQLEVFFRDYDPMRMFAGLHRVSDGRECGAAIWTTDEVVETLQGQIELATVEVKLQELKNEYAAKDTLRKEMAALADKAKQLKRLPQSGEEGLASPPPEPPGFRHSSMHAMEAQSVETPPGDPIHSNIESSLSPVSESLQFGTEQPSDSRPPIQEAYFTRMDSNGRMAYSGNGSFNRHHGSVSSVASSTASEKRRKMRSTNKGKPKLRLLPHLGILRPHVEDGYGTSK